MTTSSPAPPATDTEGATVVTESDRARIVAAAVADAASAAGIDVDDELAVWSLAGGRPEPEPRRAEAAGSDALAAVLEAATDPDRRRAQGLHVTPRWLADQLVALALPEAAIAARRRSSPPSAGSLAGVDGPTVCDPACGGGAFLLAAARRLHTAGHPRDRVVRSLVWGADIDPVGVAAAEAALWLWAGERPPAGRLVVADPLLTEGALWPEAGEFAAVVGNPPFQNQLGRATARSAADQRRLRARFGDAVRAYTDTAWLFLLAACDLVRPGGRVVMVEPQSVVGARDADAVRRALDARAALCDLWIDDERVFEASVRVCAPVLERRPDGPGADLARRAGETARDSLRPVDAAGAVADGADAWSRLWARAFDLPSVDLAVGPTLGDRATVLAGFRDQYYGLVDTVRERAEPAEQAGRGDASGDGPGVPLITSGAVDWAACAWGVRPTRYAKRRWTAPVVDLARLDAAPEIARRWVARTRAPKLVVATQTRIVEAAVDVEGRWVPSVPTLAVVPADADELWHLAAAVLSPAATAWFARRSAGTGLDRGALKVAGPDLSALPLPGDVDAWDAAALALAAFVAAPDPARLDTYLDAAARAYDVTAAVTTWWRDRAGSAVRTGATAD